MTLRRRTRLNWPMHPTPGLLPRPSKSVSLLLFPLMPIVIATNAGRCADPTNATHQTQVKAIIATLKTANMQADLTTLTAFNNRYYKATTGADSSNWIFSQLQTVCPVPLSCPAGTYDNHRLQLAAPTSPSPSSPILGSKRASSSKLQGLPPMPHHPSLSSAHTRTPSI